MSIIWVAFARIPRTMEYFNSPPESGLSSFIEPAIGILMILQETAIVEQGMTGDDIPFLNFTAAKTPKPINSVNTMEVDTITPSVKGASCSSEPFSTCSPIPSSATSRPAKPLRWFLQPSHPILWRTMQGSSPLEHRRPSDKDDHTT